MIRLMTAACVGLALTGCATSDTQQAEVDYKGSDVIYNEAPESVFIPGQTAPAKYEAPTIPTESQIAPAPDSGELPVIKREERIEYEYPSLGIAKPKPEGQATTPEKPQIWVAPGIVDTPKETAPVTAPQKAPYSLSGPVSGQGGAYTVIPGDTFYGIARRRCLDPKALMAANPTDDPNTLSPGDEITLPAWSCELGDEAVVSSLPAESSGATAAATRDDAPLVAYLGATSAHILQPGQTLYSLSKTYCTTPAQLMEMNGISDPTNLSIDQRLTVPSDACE